MYASRFATSPFNRSHGAAPRAQMYSSVAVETAVADASPHRLVAMLLDGFVEAVAQANVAMHSNQIEAKCSAIGRASRIIDEGLKASLDLTSGALATDLNDLYTYITLRLTQANFRNDASALNECLTLIQPIREAWASIARQTPAQV